MESLWFWLTTPPVLGEILNVFGAVYFAVFTVGFVVSAYLAGPAANQMSRNPLYVDGVRLWATVGLCVTGPGLFFFGVRALQINPLSFGQPIWLVTSVLALFVAAVRCADWWRKDYPAVRQSRDPDHPPTGFRRSR